MRKFSRYLAPHFFVGAGKTNSKAMQDQYAEMFRNKSDSELATMLANRNSEVLENCKRSGLPNEIIIKIMAVDSKMEAIEDELHRRSFLPKNP